MGICKCKKRSEDFCYQHKKFICENCVATDHPVCHIGSYVNWLTDSEFEDSVCGICKGEVTSDSSIRLQCYDIFHPECIDVYASSLPQTTALAGYSCPNCKKPILPSSDKTDALSQSIRKAFSLSLWAESILNTGGGGGRYTNGPAISSQLLSPSSGTGSDGSSPSTNNKPNGINHDFYAKSDTITPSTSHINTSLLEETPPLSHLNNNPYGLAIRKQTQPHTTTTGDSIIQMNNHQQQDEEEDKYNKKSLLPLQSLSRFRKENPIMFYIIVAIVCIILFYMFSKGTPVGDYKGTPSPGDGGGVGVGDDK